MTSIDSLRAGASALPPESASSPHLPQPPSPDALARSVREAGPRGLPPVERWNPPFCGDIPMSIDAEGGWHYGGTPIARPAMVKLFASILRKDPERFVLVTPVERVGIAVADAPFLAVEMTVKGEGVAATLTFRTNLDDLAEAGPEHPLRFERETAGGSRPYVLVRGGLWARATRAIWHDLADQAQEQDGMLGVWSAGAFFPIEPAGPDV